MKQSILTFLLLFVVAATLSSCNDDDPTPKFEYFKPCTDWTANETAVRSYMTSPPGWHETLNTEHTIFFKNEKTNTACICAFFDGKLAASVVTVSGFNTLYSEWQNQIGNEYGLTWNKTKLADIAIKPELLLTVAMHRFSTYTTAGYFNLLFLKQLNIEPTDFDSLLALIDKIKAGLL